MGSGTIKNKLNYVENYLNNHFAHERGHTTYLMAGCDYGFTKANENYGYMDWIMAEWNKKHPNIKMFYSTPQRYVASLNRTRKYDVKREDSFPYQLDANKYWSGYFTTRPLYKLMHRELSQEFHSVLESMPNTEFYRNMTNWILDYLSTAIHHDAITGTSFKRTAVDYMKRLLKVEDTLGQVIANWYDESDNITLLNPQAITDPNRTEIV